MAGSGAGLSYGSIPMGGGGGYYGGSVKGSIFNTGGGGGNNGRPYDAPKEDTPPPPNITAQIDPNLTQVNQEAQDYLSRLQSGTGYAMDIMGQKARDAREGGRTALLQANALAGRPSGAGLSNYEAQTQQGVQDALATTALGRESMYGQALGTALSAARAPGDQALAEKGLSLQAYQAHQQAVNAANQANNTAANDAFQQMLALLQARRSSSDPNPINVNSPYESSYGGGYMPNTDSTVDYNAARNPWGF